MSEESVKAEGIYPSMKPEEPKGDGGTMVTQSEPKMSYAPLPDTTYRIGQDINIKQMKTWGMAEGMVDRTTTLEFPNLLSQKLREANRDGRLVEGLRHYGNYVKAFEEQGFLESKVTNDFAKLIEESGHTRSEETLQKALSVVRKIKFK